MRDNKKCREYMMKTITVSPAAKAVLSAGLIALALSGCGGSDGTNGEDGPDGIIGVNIDATSTLKATFTDATVVDGKVSVDFILKNANGVAVLGLTKDHDLRFGIAQLTPVTEMVGADGAKVEVDRGYQWQSYINTTKQPNAGWIPADETNIAPSAQFQADVEAASKCADCLVDNLDGSYSYTFQTNIAQVTEPLSITYQADDTQRITLELKQPLITANAHYDFQPSTGLTEDIASRDVVSINACYTCHQPESLALHGGRRIDLENCASCHTATSGDPETGNSVDFTYMIHAIHKGQDRVTSTVDGDVAAPYKVIGYGGGVHNYGNVMYPQKPAADCSACHVEGTNAPKDAALFNANKSDTACIACHTELASQQHVGVGTNCTSCHVEEGYGRSAKEAHGDVMKAYNETQAMNAVFSDVIVTADGKFSTTIKFTDASANVIAAEFIDQGSRIVMAWDSDKNYPTYQDASYSNRRLKLSEGTANTDNSWTLVWDKITLPTDYVGKTFELWSAVTACFNHGGYGRPEVKLTACSTDDVQKVEIKSSPYHFVMAASAIDTSQTTATRRNIINTESCQGCHNQEVYHYDNGVNCQTCHTADKTLKNDDTYPGGKKSTSFAFKAHSAEGHYLKYAGVESGTVLKTDCKTCHTADGIQLGRATDRVWRYGDIDTGADVWMSSDTGACLSCHQKYRTDATVSHIESNGGIVDGISEDDARNRASEICSTCHTVDRVTKTHGF
jgi:OmcA/MtrC family decaheme c-type cytochrome